MSKWLFVTRAALNQVSPEPAVKAVTHRACLSSGAIWEQLNRGQQRGWRLLQAWEGQSRDSSSSHPFYPNYFWEKAPGLVAGSHPTAVPELCRQRGFRGKMTPGISQTPFPPHAPAGTSVGTLQQRPRGLTATLSHLGCLKGSHSQNPTRQRPLHPIPSQGVPCRLPALRAGGAGRQE